MILQYVSSISPLKKKKIDIRYHTITKALQCPNINTSHNAHTCISRLSHVGRDGGKRIDWLIGGKRQAKRKEALLLSSRRCHITFGLRRHDSEGQTAPPLVPSWNRYVNRLSEKSTPKKRREGTWESRRKKKREKKIPNDVLKLRLHSSLEVFDHLLEEVWRPSDTWFRQSEMGIRCVFFRF